MAPPATPYVDIRTGSCVPSNAEIPRNATFRWYNSNPQGGLSCSVTIAGTWCSAPSNPIAAQASAPSTVASTTADGFYNWSSECCMSAQPVHVKGTSMHPREKEKK